MPEKLEEILNKGFYVWKKNLNISVPFFLDLISGIIVAGIFLILGIILLIFSLSPLLSISDISEIPSSINKFAETGIAVIPILVVFLVIFLIVVQIINSFFYSGAIGMAKTAIETGNTKISDMRDYGKKKFLDVFFANIIVFIIYLLGVLFFLPGILSIFLLDRVPFAVIFFLLGIIGLIAYLIVASIVLSPVQYAVVISDARAIEGIKKGFRFFMNNKLDVFILWFIILLISAVIGFFTWLLQFIVEFIPLVGWILSILITIASTLISVLIIAPLSTVWWTMLYMDRK